MAAENIDALELEITSKTSTENLDKLIEALNKLGTSLDKIQSKKVSVSIKETGNAANSSAGSVDKLTNSFFNQAIRVTALVAVYKKLAGVISDGIANSMNYTKTLNMFTVSMGDYSENATKYGNTVRDALGIDISSWQNAQGIFQTLITGFGVSGDQAAYMSQNLTQLSYDIASFYGITNEEAQNKLKSAISGRLEPIRKLGWDLSQSKLVDIAKNPKNYGKQTYSINEQTGAIESNTTAVDDNTKHKIVNFNQLTQQEKVQLRYIALMTQVTQVQGNMAKTLNDPNNQMRVFKEQLNMTSRELGNVFIPIINKALPYLTAFAQLAEEALQSLALLVGFELPNMKDRIGDATIANPYNDIVKATGKAANNAKKLKDYTLGIDELNVLRPDTGTSGGSGSKKGENSNLNNLLTPGYDFLSKAVKSSIEEAKKNIQKFFNDLKKKPISLPIEIFTTGASILGENFWEAVLGKSPEELAKEAFLNGRSIEEQFYYGLAWSSADAASKLWENLFGTPEELAKRAKEAGNDVGKQFAIELGISIAEVISKSAVMKELFKIGTGKDIDKELANLKKGLEKTKRTKVEGVKYEQGTSSQSAYAQSTVPFLASSNMSTVYSQVGKANGQAYGTAYAKGLNSTQTTVKTAGTNVYNAGINGSTSNGQGKTKFYNASAEEARKYAEGLSSQKVNVGSSGTGLYTSAYNGVNKDGSALTNFKNKAIELAKGFASNLSNNSEKTQAYNSGIALATRGAEGSLSKKSGYTSAGENSGKGYIAGIDKYKSSALSAGATIASNALKKLKEVLGIKSPSREFGKAGMFSVLGYANSVEDYSYKATEAVEEMARMSLKAVNSSANMFSFPGYSASNNAGYGIGMANSDSMMNLAGNIYQAVVSGMSGLNLNAGNGQNIKIIIDGKEVFKVVQTEARNRGVAISDGAFSR